MGTKEVTIMTSDLAHIVPHIHPNVPPIDYISDGIFIGEAEFLNTPICLSLERLLAPTGLIIGKIGTGKSTSARTILIRQHILYRTSILIFDPHGEYTDDIRSLGGKVIDMKDHKINPCKMGVNLENNQKTNQLLDILQTVFELNSVQVHYLRSYIKRCYQEYGDGFHFTHLIEKLRKDANGNSILSKTLIAILVRIEILADNVFGDENSIPINDLTQGLVCIDLTKLENNELRNMTMLSILQFIYNGMLSEQRIHSYDPDGKLRLLIMIDEAGRVAAHENSVAVRMVKESRKFKIGLMFAFQDLPDLDPRIKSNYGFMIVHKLDDSEYISRIQRDGNFTPEQASKIRSLPVGSAYVKLNFKDSAVQRPFLVRILRENIGKIVNETKESQKQDYSDQQSKILAPLAEPANILQGNPCDKLSSDGSEMLDLIARTEGMPTTWYYQQLNLSSFRGNRAKKELKEKGLIKSKELPTIVQHGRSGVALYLSDKGKELLQVNQTNRHGGVVHKHIIGKIATRFADQKVAKEYPIGGGKEVDLAIINKKTAIEVETRNFSRSNVIKSLRYGFERVIVVCSKEKLKKFEKDLKSSGIDNGKVWIMTADKILTKYFSWE